MGELIQAAEAVRRFCTFRVQGRLYGIDVAQVRELSTQVACAPVPQAPPTVRGLTNLRSRICLVLDIRPQLGLPPSEGSADSRLLMLQARVAEDLGLFVDCGGDIVSVPSDQIEETAGAGTGEESLSSAPATSPVVGVCKLEDELMMIIDPTRLVAATDRAMRESALNSTHRTGDYVEGTNP